LIRSPGDTIARRDRGGVFRAGGIAQSYDSEEWARVPGLGQVREGGRGTNETYTSSVGNREECEKTLGTDLPEIGRRGRHPSLGKPGAGAVSSLHLCRRNRGNL